AHRSSLIGVAIGPIPDARRSRTGTTLVWSTVAADRGDALHLRDDLPEQLRRDGVSHARVEHEPSPRDAGGGVPAPLPTDERVVLAGDDQCRGSDALQVRVAVRAAG